MKALHKRIARWTEFLLLLVGTLCVAFYAHVQVQSTTARLVGEEFGRVHASAQVSSAIPIDVAPGRAKEGSVIGRLEIRPLALSVPIMSDYESASLLKGIGHVPGTAMPGGLGTVGLAGHRDTYFRPLRNIKKDMDIRLVDRSGVYHYQVDSTEIVSPEEVEVLAIGSRPALTLITCYPFYFVGSAPKRFIVHAHLLSLLADQ